MSNPTSIPRLHSVKFKNGGEVRVIRHETNEDRKVVEQGLRNVLNNHSESDIAGFAIIVWGTDGGSTVSLGRNDKSQIPSILIPDFVRSRLLAEKIEQWTIDTVNNQWSR